jgi:hypothetical protein
MNSQLLTRVVNALLTIHSLEKLSEIWKIKQDFWATWLSQLIISLLLTSAALTLLNYCLLLFPGFPCLIKTFKHKYFSLFRTSSKTISLQITVISLTCYPIKTCNFPLSTTIIFFMELLYFPILCIYICPLYKLYYTQCSHTKYSFDIIIALCQSSRCFPIFS